MATNQTGIFFLGSSSQGNSQKFPIQFNSNIFKNIDKIFLTILITVGFVLCTTFFILSLRPLPEVSEQEIIKIQERYAQLVLNQPKKKIKKAIKTKNEPIKKTDVSDEVEKKVKVDRKNETVQQKKQRKQASSETRAQKRADISKKLASTGIFAAITATGGGAGDGAMAVSDLLGAGSALGALGDVDISSGSFATKDVSPEMVATRRGNRKGGVSIKKSGVGTASRTQIASSGAVKISSKPPEIKGEVAKSGSRSKAAINRYITRQQSRLRKVFEMMLKRDPNLCGSIKIRFTINADGTVSNVAVVNSTTKNSTFDNRIISYIKRWNFGSGGSGPLEIVVPFSFSGAS